METTTERREVKKIIIHTSASAFGNAALIDSWHREKGWDSIGYHKVILNGRLENSKDYDETIDGHVETGRSDETVGAHCYGQNKDSVGICLVGEPYSYTTKQYVILIQLISAYQLKYEGANVFFHSEFNKDKPKCPGIKAVDILTALA